MNFSSKKITLITALALGISSLTTPVQANQTAKNIGIGALGLASLGLGLSKSKRAWVLGKEAVFFAQGPITKVFINADAAAKNAPKFLSQLTAAKELDKIGTVLGAYGSALSAIAAATCFYGAYRCYKYVKEHWGQN